jgi:microcystin-dependent protein
MADPFIGQIMIVPYTFAPRNWAECDGQLLSIAQNQALFSLLGTNYGGDGSSTFGLPDLRGRFPMHLGTGPGLTQRNLAQKFGTENNTLDANQIPGHSHTGTILSSTAEGDRTDPTGAYPARPEEPLQPYAGSSEATMAAGGVQVSSAGSGQGVNNMPPTLVLRFVIALAGIYPSQN